MSVLGLIVEYNPFHNGHLYHFNTSFDLTQAEYSVCVMSGNFVQRGEPALVDKWSRTHMALNAGADLVIEIPVIFCVQSAEIFAYGAISLLNSLGIIDSICFGSETGSIDLLKSAAGVLANEPLEYRKLIRQESDSGISFAVSRSRALLKYMSRHMGCEHLEIIENMLQTSNNILGLEYLKWLIRLDSTIIPYTIKRMYSGYNNISVDTPYASATAVRNAIHSSTMDSIDNLVPKYTLDILKKQFVSGMGPVFFEDFSRVLLCLIRRMRADEIAEVMDVNEGLENKIKKASLESSNLDELIYNIKSKRYAETRIRRILIHILLGIYKKDFHYMKSSGGPQYVRVLGFSEKGRKLLSKIKEKCSLPIITNTGDYRKIDNDALKRMIELDILSTDIYVSAYSNEYLRKGGHDFYIKPVMI